MSDNPTPDPDAPPPDHRRLIRTRRDNDRVRVYCGGDVLGYVRAHRTPARQRGKYRTRWQWCASALAWTPDTPPPGAAGRLQGEHHNRAAAIAALLTHLRRHRVPAVATLYREPQHA